MKKIISNIILCLLIVLVLVRYLPIFFGYQIYAIESGSMEPTYPIGSMIVVEKCEFKDVHVNDVITFRQSSSNHTKTHRIVAVDEALLRFTTKGDNNAEEDAQKVSAKALIGKVVFSVSIVGYIYLFIDTLPGMICILLLAFISIYLHRHNNDKSNVK